MNYKQISQRKNWFEKINKSKHINSIGNLVSTLELKSYLTKLQQDVVDILCDSLRKKKKKQKLELFLKENKNYLKNVQRTDGSIIKIFYDNFLSYMKLHQTLLKILKVNNLSNNITGFSLINLRLVDKVLNPDRPYATTKLHIDIFANEPLDIVHFWIPLSKNKIENEFELNQGPEKLNSKWFKIYKKYDEFSFPNLSKADISRSYKKGIIFDGICPHRTLVNNNLDYRISMDVKLRRIRCKDHENYASNYNDIEKFKKMILC